MHIHRERSPDVVHDGCDGVNNPWSAAVVDGGEVEPKQADAGNARRVRGLGDEQIGMNATGALGLSRGRPAS